MDNIDISIIVPVYNLEHFIDPLLRSLKAQILGDYTAEFIFVINNCTDRSEEIIRSSGLPCRIIYCEKQGSGNARNAGFNVSRGEYIWFIDGDDWLLSDTAIKQVLDKGKGKSALLIPFESNSFRRMYFAMPWQYLLRREFVKDIKFPNKQPGEDDEYIRQVLIKLGYNYISYRMMPRVEQPLYFYNYMREGSNMYQYYKGEQFKG